MLTSIERRLAKLQNEINAQKVFSGLTYSQLLLPENSPMQTYSGTIDLSSSSDPIARLLFRFERTDGISETPMINFSYSASISPSYKSFAESYGFVFSANDLSYIETTEVTGYISSLGDGYVDFYVDFDSALKRKFFSLSSLSFSVTCQAISNVRGNLTVERVR